MTRTTLGLVAAAAVVVLVVWGLRARSPGSALEGAGAVAREDASTSAALEPPERLHAVATKPTAREGAVAATAVGVGVRVVTDETHAPIAEALVLALDAAGEIERARTDAEGRATLSAGFEVVRVAACAAGYAAAALDVTAGEPIELALRGEGVLAGVVLVDSTPPREPIELRLWTTAGVGDLALLEPFAEALREERGFLGEGSLLTDTHGHFELHGLDPDWSGAMRVPRTLRIRSTRPELPLRDHEFVDLRALVSDLVIDATRLPVLRGRVVDAASRAPMPGVSMDAWVEFEGDKVHSPTIGCQTDADGRFAVGLEPSDSRYREPWLDPAQRAPVARIELRVHGSGDVSVTHFKFDASELTDPLDVGDLAVSPSAALFLRIVDAAGAPVAGARVGGERKASEATDADGRARMAGLPAGPLDLTAAAFGYRPLVIELGAERGSELEPVELVLATGSVVELVLVGPGGERPEGLSVRVVLPPDAFGGVDARRLGQTAFEQLTGPFHSRIWNDERLSMGLLPHPDGSLALSGLRAGIEGTVRVWDSISQIAGERRFVSPPDGERLKVRLEVAATEVDVRGRVIDEAGAPLPRARVAFGRPNNERNTRTDADGHFSYGPLIAGGTDSAVLIAEFPGMLTRVLEDIRIIRDMPPIEVVLTPGLSFGFELVEESGRPAPTTDLYARAPGFRIGEVRALGEGRFEIERVPLAELELIASLGGREHRFKAHTSDERARFTLPDHGVLAVEHYDLEDMVARITVPSEPEFEHTAPVAEPIALLPGSYVVEPVRWESSDGERGWVSYGNPRPFEIRAGETARVGFTK